MNRLSSGTAHRHGRLVHSHPYSRPHRHLVRPRRSQPLAEPAPRDAGHGHRHGHSHEHDHDHSHGLIDRSILRSREGIKAVSISLLVLALAAGAQAVVFVLCGDVARHAALIHNVWDAVNPGPQGNAV